MSRSEVLSKIRDRLVATFRSAAGKETAEDIAQETVLRLETKFANVSNETELIKISFGIANNVKHEFRRKSRADRELPPPDVWNPVDPRDPLGSGIPDQAFLNQVKKCAKELTGRCPELLLLLLEGYTADEIRGKMGAARTGTVHVWVHRCYQALAKKLGIGG